MQERLKKYHGCNSSSIWLCIEDVEAQSGTFLTPCVNVPVPFHGLGAFLLKANTILDAIEFPQRYMARRNFLAHTAESTSWIEEHLQEPMPDSGMERMLSFRRKSSQSQFHIRVMYRRNASWQGEVIHASGKCKRYFRSALELMELIEEATCRGRGFSSSCPFPAAVACAGG